MELSHIYYISYLMIKMAEFFEKLQDKVNLEENIEGIRNILLSIYRNGTISIKNISRITKIPIPVVSRIIKILIEKDFLTRNDKGVQFWEHSMKYVEESFNFYGFGIEKCPTCKGRPNYISPRYEILFDKLNQIFENRPSVDSTLDQSKNLVETAIQRAIYLYDKGALEGKNILFIGDDDFTSIAVCLLYLIFYPEEPDIIPNSITIIDIDDRILNEIKNVYSEYELPLNKLNCINYNLREIISSELLEKFDTIITDPPYSANGLKLFLSRAISMIKTNDKYCTGKDIFLSYAHRSSEKTLEIQSLIDDMGLSIMELIPRFNKYEGAEVLGNQTQMFHLKTTSKTKAIIPAEEKFLDIIYTGESHPYIRKYKCKGCEAVIIVGPDNEYETIEILKGNKCPKCKVSKKFDLIERNIKL